MRFSLLKILGLLFLIVAFFSALRARRDLSTDETQWGRTLFHRSTPIRRTDSPLRYWLATAFNVAVVLLFALAAVFILRAGAMRLGLH